VVASRAASFAAPAWAPVEPLTYAEAFHLATVGGAAVLGLSEVCGNFVHGKQLDALVVRAKRVLRYCTEKVVGAHARFRSKGISRRQSSRGQCLALQYQS